MRFKSIPPAPEDLGTLERTWQAVGLVPEGERSCCRRIADRLDEVDLDEARRWLALLRALDLVERGGSGYTRTRTFPDREGLRSRFLSGVFGVEELLSAATETSMNEAAAFEALEPHVPVWERHRAPAMWRDRWRERASRLLEWGALFGLFEPVADGYRVAPNVIGDTGP